MDTVEGIKGSKLLMTLINKKTSFLFGIPIRNKKQENSFHNRFSPKSRIQMCA